MKASCFAEPSTVIAPGGTAGEPPCTQIEWKRTADEAHNEFHGRTNRRSASGQLPNWPRYREIRVVLPSSMCPFCMTTPDSGPCRLSRQRLPLP